MVFIPLGEVLGSGSESLVGSGLVPFVFEGDKYSEEPSFFIASCEVFSGEAREWHLMMTGEWSRWGVPKLFSELAVRPEDGGDGKRVWDWSACLPVSPIL